jgi:hypothetical protein
MVVTESIHTLLSCFGTRLPLDEVVGLVVWPMRSFASAKRRDIEEVQSGEKCSGGRRQQQKCHTSQE